MKQEFTGHPLVLAINPTSRGFGFALFNGPREPIDWGVKEVRKHKNVECVHKIEALIDFYQPDVIVVENYAGEGSRRCPRIQDLIRDIKKLARRKKVKSCGYSRGKIREVFAQFGAQTKYEIAKVIAKWMPEFERRLPPVRKPWMSEDYRMAIFDAVSLTLTFYYVERESL